jgi:hypothetical protein
MQGEMVLVEIMEQIGIIDTRSFFLENRELHIIEHRLADEPSLKVVAVANTALANTAQESINKYYL